VLNFFAWISLLSIVAAVAFQSLYFLSPLPLVLLVYLSIQNTRSIFYLTLLSVPFAVEIYLPNGLSTDLPTEPLAFGSFLIFLLLAAVNKGNLLKETGLHPLLLLIVLHLFWILITVLNAEIFTIALKFFLAKVWFTFAFLFFGLYAMRTEEEIEKAFKILFWALIPAMLFTFIRSAMDGFDFNNVNKFMYPFFRNKVFYSSILLFTLPIGLYLFKFERQKSMVKSLLIGLVIVLFVLGIVSAYTRATLALCLLIPFVPLVLRYKLMRPTLIIGFVIAFITLVHTIKDNRFLLYAPEYETTISHDKFSNLLEATAKGKDVSTMERVYRWVAGGYMIKERPLFGFGPNNFYPNYKQRTLNIFRTYVSDNPEKSGIHSYYLMLAVEQGLPGLLIFLIITVLFLIRAEKVYNSLEEEKPKELILAVTTIFIFFTLLQFINDFVEAYKVGVFWFFCIAVLIRIESNAKAKRNFSFSSNNKTVAH
jgi:O-antigen ligase